MIFFPEKMALGKGAGGAPPPCAAGQEQPEPYSGMLNLGAVSQPAVGADIPFPERLWKDAAACWDMQEPREHMSALAGTPTARSKRRPAPAQRGKWFG